MTNKVRISFGRVFWPSLLASVIVLIILVGFFFALIGSLMADKKPYAIKKNTVLHMTLSGNIAETSDANFDPTTFNIVSSVGMSSLLYGLERAAKDDKVAGLFIEIESANCGYARATEIRNAINQFEASGKFVVTYLQGEAIGIKQYYIASAANEIYGFPSSMFEFGGLGAELMYFKRLFDKLDLEMQVVRGSDNDFKSAVEPYFLEKMSDSSRIQIQRYLNSMWEEVTTAIGKERGISVQQLNEYADNTSIRRVSHAVNYNLVNASKYRDEVLQLLAEKTGVSSSDDLELENFNRYARNKFNMNQRITKGKKPNIAVISAEGVVTKKGEGLSSDKITKLIKEARQDENIKVIVFRINSPGGSALASDEIWREVMLTRELKPVIVSMGDVAASGGYYMAVPAHRIFAEANTVTGSIGVFGVIPYTGSMLENKLGLTFDRVGTNTRSVLSTNKKLSPEEFAIIQEEVDFIYEEFLERVAEGRNMTLEAVHQIARGRVWTGKDALKNGLIDEIGGLSSAIKYAQQHVDISDEDAQIIYYPKRKVEPWMEILEAFDDKNTEVQPKTIPAELMKYYELIQSVEDHIGIQARLPYEIKF